MGNRLTVGIVSDDSIEIIWSQDGFPQIIYSNNVWYGHLKKLIMYEDLEELSGYELSTAIHNQASEILRLKDEIEEIKKHENDSWIEFTLEYSEEDGLEILDCKLPEEDEEILVTDGKTVWQDTFMKDGNECYLDSGNAFIVDAIAWMPLPQPYKVGDEE